MLLSLEASEGKGKAAWGSPGLNVRCVSWGRGSGRDLLDVWTWSKVLFRQREVKLRRVSVSEERRFQFVASRWKICCKWSCCLKSVRSRQTPALYHKAWFPVSSQSKGRMFLLPLRLISCFSSHPLLLNFIFQSGRRRPRGERVKCAAGETRDVEATAWLWFVL